MQRLMSKARDILNEVENKGRQGGMKRREEIDSWLEKVNIVVEQVESIETEFAQERGKMFRLSNKLSLFRPGSPAEKLVGIMERGEQLLKQSEFPRGLLVDDVKHEGLELLAKKMEGSTPSMVEDEVWNCFEIGESRVGLFGIGGVGKTSLSLKINNQIFKQKRVFKCVYYVTISRETSVLKFQSDIAKAFKLCLNYEDVPKRAAELRMALAKREKCLLIFDDVWEDIPMEEVGVLVEGDGCKLIITTRQSDVCWRMDCFPVKMEPLLLEESWDLFKKEIGNFETLADEVKSIAHSVAKECDGLPLGIVTMARSMRGVTSVHLWRNALNRLQNPCSGHHYMKDKVFGILSCAPLSKSSGSATDDKHRRCFLYCALYPEDYEIGRNELISELIAAGILDGTNRNESIDEGHALLKDLENASLLDSVNSDCVKMHDLVRDMAIEIVGSTGILKGGRSLKEIPAKEEWNNKDLEWVSLMSNYIYCIEGIMPDCPKISVLLLRENNFLRSVSDSFFVQMIGLKVLDLSHTEVKELPDSVSKLVNLNTLLLFACEELEYIPSLANLTKLRELDLCFCQRMRTLPEGMEKLTSLEVLKLDGIGIKGVLMGIFINLLTLENLECSGDIYIPVEELISLKHLKELHWFQFIFKDVSELRQFDAWFKSLETYHVTAQRKDCVDDKCNIDYELQDRELKVMGAEECFLVPRNVRTLKLTECSFGVGSFLEALPSLADVTDLQRCHLDHCQGIEYIIPEGWTKNTLQGINRLELQGLDELGGLISEEVVRPFSFLCLRKLEIAYCKKLKKLWMPNLDLPNLEEIHISRCKKMEQIFATEKGGTVTLPSLSSLYFSCLPNLRSICGDCKVFFPNLLHLEVWFTCVKNIGMVCRLPSLETIKITGCREMKEIFLGKDEAGNHEIHLPKLKKLELIDMPELRSITRQTIVCNSLQDVSVDGRSSGVKMENCPLSSHFQSFWWYP